jgi:hypothetical protein
VKVVGGKDFSTAWNAYEEFESVNVSGNFVVEFDFKNRIKDDAENWNNWALVFKNGDNLWYLRADAYSVETLSGEGSVGYWGSWDSDWAAFKKMFKDADVRVRAEKDGYITSVYAYLKGAAADGSDSLVYAVKATGTPIGDYEVMLGVDNSYLELSRVSTGVLENRTIVGKINDGGEYVSGFNAEKSADYKVSGDFNASFRFMNYGNKPVYGVADANKAENWDNYIVRATADGATTLLRADAYAMDNAGTFTYERDWEWDDFPAIMRNAEVQMNVSRKNDVVTYDAEITAQDGKVYHYKAVNAGVSTADMSLGFTCEKSAVDLLSVSVNSVKGDSTKTNVSDDSSTTSIANRRAVLPNGLQNPARRGLRDLKGRRYGKQVPYRVLF